MIDVNIFALEEPTDDINVDFANDDLVEEVTGLSFNLDYFTVA